MATLQLAQQTKPFCARLDAPQLITSPEKVSPRAAFAENFYGIRSEYSEFIRISRVKWVA